MPPAFQKASAEKAVKSGKEILMNYDQASTNSYTPLLLRGQSLRES